MKRYRMAYEEWQREFATQKKMFEFLYRMQCI